MNRLAIRQIAAAAAGALLFAACGWAQSQYRVVTPDGKVLYTDRPPASSRARVTEIQPPGSRSAAPAGKPAVPDAADAEVRECRRRHAPMLRLIQAAHEVIRARDDLKYNLGGVTAARGQPALDRAWKRYVSLGGKARAADDVQVPPDPCRPQVDFAGHQAAAKSAGYRACVSSRVREVRLANLSRELVENRDWLERAGKSADADDRSPAGLDRAEAQAALKRQFADFRKAGGKAVRVEEVQPIPDPCAEISAAGSSALK